MSAWKIVTNFAIPPALILTVLLIIPVPQKVKRGLLVFTQKVLFFNLAGSFQLVHVMIAVTGMALAACSLHTYQLSNAVLDAALTPNTRTGLLAKKWREERNFWIALLSFLLWANLNRLYTLLLDHAVTHARMISLENDVKFYKGRLAAQGVTAPAHAEPSAPPVPEETNSTLVNRGKNKAIKAEQTM